MDAAAAGGGGGGGGGPAPFLLKTYDMVDDSSTDEIVSWSSTKTSFVVWNPPDFAAKLLPTYFKHNNFSSFIRQLNTYGFRKIDPERWEFANEEFIKDQKHLLKNIHRRKPIHSHSNPPGSSALPESERIALEEEIERLSREKAALSAELWRFKQQQSGTKIQLDDLERRLSDIEERQAKMLAFLDRALRNPKFVENLIKMAGSGASSADFSLLHKKRRLPGVDYCLEIAENSFYDSSSDASKQDAGQVFNQDFGDKLKLGLCPAALSESNSMLAVSIQSSNEAGGSSRMEQDTNGNGRLECLSFVPEALELSDTGTSLCPRKSCLFAESIDDGDGLISCHLNLTLASSPMQIDKNESSSRTQNSEEVAGNAEASDEVVAKNQKDSGNGSAPHVQETAQTGNQGPPAVHGRVNDLFWEQFLTERPGSSDAEEASSSLRTDPSDDQQEDRKLADDSMLKNRNDMEQLTL